MSKLPQLTISLTLLITISACGGKPQTEAMAEENTKTSVESITDAAYDPGSDYQLVWADEFDGSELDTTNWNRQVEPAGRFNEEWQRYTESPENAYIENNQLVLKANHESDTHGIDQYTSGRLNTAGKQSWQYGKIVTRMKLPYGEGLWPAFWLLGDNIDENGGDTPWPFCGEIDILELYGSKDDGVIEANIHYADSAGEHGMLDPIQYKLEEGRFADDFHVFELEWDEQQMRWLVDGNEYASVDITGDEFKEFHNKYFLLLNVAVGGTWAGRPDASTSFPQYMYVDWVRVYQKG